MNIPKHKIGEVWGDKTIIGFENLEKGKLLYVLKCNCGEIYKFPSCHLKKGTNCKFCKINIIINTKNYKCLFLKYLGNKVFECLCDCGKIYIARNRSKSCGCHKEEGWIKDAKKLVGVKYGAIKILSFSHFEIGKNRARHALYNAKCKCGNIFKIKRIRIFKNKTCGCRILSNHARGERQGNNKYKQEDVISIKNLFFTGCYSTEDLSKMFNVSVDTIRSLVSNRGWKHISPNNDLLINNPLSKRLEPKKKVKIGEKYGYWKALEKVASKHSHAYWLCLCDCGNKHEVSGDSLLNGRSTKCHACNAKNFANLNRKNKFGSDNIFLS